MTKRGLPLAPVVILWTSVASADVPPTPSRVVLIVPAEQAPPASGVDEIAVRLRGELVAAGFEVAESRMEPEDDPRASVEQAAASHRAFATVLVHPLASGIDVWVADRVTGKTLVKKIESGGADADAREISVRAIELLRASLLEATLARGAPEAPSVPHDVAVWSRPPPRAAFDRFGVFVGLGVLHSFGPVGPSVVPSVGAFYSPWPRWAASITFAGPGFAPRIDDASGSASVREELATLAAMRELQFGSLSLAGSLGVGVYHLDAQGSALPPRRAARADVWAGLVAIGAGATFRLQDRIHFLAKADVLVLVPRPVLVMDERIVAHTGRPSALFTTGILVSFP